MKKVLYFIYQWLVFLPIAVVATIIAALVTIVACFITGNTKFWGYYPAAIWARFICRLALMRIETTGLENLNKNQSYVFVANHQGAFDIFLIYGYLGHNFKWLMKKSLRKIPFVGKSCEVAGHVFVDRSTKSGIQQTIKDAEDKLKHGISTVVFPEGSRTLDGKMHAFKKGAFQLALDLHLPIVPLRVDGSFKVLKRGSVLMSPEKLKLTIHKPIYTTDLKMEDMPKLISEVWHILANQEDLVS